MTRSRSGGAYSADHSDVDRSPDLPPSVEQAAEALAAIVRSSSDAIFTVSLDGTIQTWNRGAARLYGYPAERAIGHTFHELFPNDDVGDTALAADVIRSGEAVENIEVRRTWPDGTVRDLMVTMSPIFERHGQVEAIAAVVGDITPLKRAERALAASLDELRAATFRDRLTGLGSRQLLMERLETLPTDATDVFVLLLDVDEFQYFNQTFGHTTADGVLQALAGVLAQVIDPGDVLARTDGDEFAVVSHSKGSQRGADLAEAIQRHLAAPLAVGSEHHAVSVGIGVATAPAVWPGVADFLLRRADIAQYEAKRAGHGLWRTYDADMDAAYAARGQMEERLRGALASGDQLRLVFQPICTADTRQITEVEALLRWDDPKRGPISPVEFIPVAEHCGVIVALGEWVLREACHTVAGLGPIGLGLRLNVNVSPRQLADPGFADVVARTLEHSGLPPAQLVLEITESVIVGSGETLTAELDRLRELGVGLAVDDFGTGHSSLARLHALPFTTLKIDKSLIDGIGGDRGGDIIIDAIIGMAHGLALSVVAEGVELPDQLDRLRDLGCDLIQGFLLHQPMAEPELCELLRRQNDAISG